MHCYWVCIMSSSDASLLQLVVHKIENSNEQTATNMCQRSPCNSKLTKLPGQPSNRPQISGKTMKLKLYKTL